MQKLVECELVHRIEPEDEIAKIKGFDQGFISLLDAMGDIEAGDGASRIHRDKATFDLWAELRTRGLVREDHAVGDGGWMKVDDRVARLYMVYLARCLGRLLGREPITDQRQAFAPLAGAALSAHSLELDRMRAIVLAGVLPAPDTPVPPKQLAAFKAKHWEKLRAFRLHVEGSLLDCLKEPEEIRGRRLELAAIKLEQGVQEIESLMKPRWPTKRGVFCAGLSGAPAAGKAVATGDPFEVAGAAAPIVVEVVNSILGRPPEALANSPLAFAALAQKKLGKV